MFAKLNLALIATLIALPAAAQEFGRDSVYANRQASAPAVNAAASVNVLGRDSVYAFGKKGTAPITVAVTYKPGRA